MNLYKINETLEHSYYQMPQELFENGKYKNVSIEAKVIYAFLLNRMNLSRINKWINDKGEIYLIYTRKEIQSKLNLSDKPVTRAFKELRETNLIKEEKQGFGKPNLIYIGKIEHEELPINDIDTDNYTKLDNILADNRIKEDYYVGEDTIQETAYLRANKKDNKKHKMEAKCNLGNCGEHAAIMEMLKNNESEIDKIVAYSAKGQIYAPCGRCRELIRMVNDKNLNTKVMVAENKVCILKDLLPEMYISKKDNKENK